MRRVRYTLMALVVAAASAPPCRAQSSALDPVGPVAPQQQVHFDVSLAGLSVGFAVRNTSRTSLGASVGIGGNWLNYMILGGRHFSEENGLSYDTKDGRTGKALLELLRGTVFVRTHFEEGRQLDVGVKASGFLHSDSSDDDFGGGTFVGLNVAGTWLQWRRLRVGSELDAGRYAEGATREFGVNVAPLLLRLTVP